MKKSFVAFAVSSLLLAGCSTVPTTPPKAVSIQDIQGEGQFSPMVNVKNRQYISENFYQVQGVITAIQHRDLGRDLKEGFFMQAPSDNNPKTSDGIFVQTGRLNNLKVGDLVEVVAKVSEDYAWTKLVDVNSVKVISSNQPLPKAETLKIGKDFFASMEQYEGMLVRLDKSSDIRVTRNYGFDHKARRNNLALSHKSALLHPNQLNAPKDYDPSKDEFFMLESFQHPGNGKILWYPDFGKPNASGSSDHYIRLNDQVNGLEGVLGYSYQLYRLYVTNHANADTFIHQNPRGELPTKKAGNLRIASFNVLNYFNPPFNQASRNPLRQNRGAKTLAEFELQSEKIAQAIVKMNADIVGLMEIENNGFDEQSAVYDLVQKINAKIKNPAEHYAYFMPKNGEKFIGTDAITNQVLYKKNKVSLADYQIIPMPEQHAPSVRYNQGKYSKVAFGNVYQRHSLAPTFTINGTNKQLTVAVNHFKSKGSACWEDVKTGNLLDKDLQGACENLRVAAAVQLGESLSKIKGEKVILGDLNSYGNEDPIMVLTNRNNAPKNYVIKTSGHTYLGGNKPEHQIYDENGKVVDKSYGYVNIVRKLHPNAYSYSYNQHIGSLDYLLISPNLVSSVVDARDWNINAGESTLFEYANKYNCDKNKQCSNRFKDIFRASDHDPAVLDLNVSKMK